MSTLLSVCHILCIRADVIEAFRKKIRDEMALNVYLLSEIRLKRHFLAYYICVTPQKAISSALVNVSGEVILIVETISNVLQILNCFNTLSIENSILMYSQRKHI